jgi:hypothetical protein
MLGGGLAYGLLSGLSVWQLGGLESMLAVWESAKTMAEVTAEIERRMSSWDYGLASGLVHGVKAGLIFGLVYKLIIGLAVGLSSGEIAMKTTPNEGIYRSARIALISALGSALGIGPVFALIDGPTTGLGVGLVAGLATGIRYGGRACLQHLVLRLGLWYQGSIPWRYVDFLDYAAERLFLRKVGGGYLFIHRLLQEYFAALYHPDRGDAPPHAPPPPS